MQSRAIVDDISNSLLRDYLKIRFVRPVIYAWIPLGESELLLFNPFG